MEDVANGKHKMKKYKIAFLISHPIQYTSPLFEEMAKHPQIDLTVLYCSEESVKEMGDTEFQRKIKWDIPLIEGYRYKFLKNYSPRPTVFWAPFGLINVGIIGQLQRDRYDAVILHGWHYVTHWLAIITAVLKGIPLFIRSESPLSHELLKPKWKIFIKKAIFGTLFKHISGFLAIGSENREFYKFYGANEGKIHFTPYAVDNERFIEEYNRLAGERDEIRKGLGISSGKTAILFVGKLIKKKRPKDLLTAYEKLHCKEKALIFAGEGELKKHLQGYAKEKNLENVFFAGFINQKEIASYYSAADIFVLPSTIGETWGLAVNEAMCFHIPIIISDLTGCGRDLVRQGENGFIFKTGNVDELAEELMKLAEDSSLRKMMGDRSFEIIQEWNYKCAIDGIIYALEYNQVKTSRR